MKEVKLSAVFALGLIATAPALADTERFSGIVGLPDSESVTFDLRIPVGEVASLQLPQGLTLEFAARGSSLAANHSRVSLYSSSGATLHTAENADPDANSKSLAYVICDERPVYLSPAPEEFPGCSEL